MKRGWSIDAAIRQENECFKVNNYQGIGGETTFTVLPGKGPVLVSAPHAVKHMRLANTVPKEEDEFTGTLALLLHNLTSCHAIFAAASDLDPNFHDNCPYKTGLAEIVRANDIKLVLDLHGAALWRDFAVDVGTCKGKSYLGKDIFLVLLKDAFAAEGIADVRTDHTFSGCGQDTVTRFVSEKLGVPALQLEINKRYRDPEQDPALFSALVEALRAYILELTARL